MQNTNYVVNPFVNTSDSEKFKFVLENYLSEKAYTQLVKVVAVNEDGTVDILPLVVPFSLAVNAPIESEIPIYNIPVIQLQRGTSAIVMKPAVGDIGLILVCDKDITLVKANRAPAIAPTARTNALTDSVYLGGVLNEPATQFIEFRDDGIVITSPQTVSINAKTCNITAATNITGVTKITGDTTIEGNLNVTQNITAANISASGNVADSGGTLGEMRVKYNGHFHFVTVDGSQIASTTPRDT